MDNTFDFDYIRSLIARCDWTWSKSYVDIPHEYIHRDHCALTRDEFYYIVNAQRAVGITERWGNYLHQYLYIDCYKYWTMGDPLATTFILNRQRLFDQFDKLEWPYENPYSRKMSCVVSDAVVSTFPSRNIFECGLGQGDFVRDSGISPANYYGVDPSKKAVNNFRGTTSGFYRRCSTKSFEQSVLSWRDTDSVLVALFGTASYFMQPYIDILVNSGKDYFLMFYREGWRPDVFKDMSDFGYTEKHVASVFNKAYKSRVGNYLVVCSRFIDWKKYIERYEESDTSV